MQTTEQLVEEAVEKSIKINFKKDLPKTQHDLAFQIMKEVVYEAKYLSFAEWQQRVAQLEQDFLALPEGRFAYLFLQMQAGVATKIHFDKINKSNYTNRGIEQAKIWLVEGDTSIWNVLLLLYIFLGEIQRTQGQIDAAIATYQQGLTHAQAWLDDASLWEQVLKLYVNLGDAQEQQGQVDAAIATYQQGLTHAQAWLDDASVWEQVLQLYFNLGAVQGKQGQVDAAIATYQQGLTHAQAWLDEASVWEQVLKLYVNLGDAQEQQGQVDAAIATYQQGLTHAQAWLDEVSVWKRVLNLYVNLGWTQGKQGQVDAAIATCQQGLTHAQAWLDEASVWEPVLYLYDIHSADLYNSGHIAVSLPYFPVINYFLWQEAKLDSQDLHRRIDNQKNHFEYLTSPINLTNYFQAFLHQLITEWHHPDNQHRHP